MSVFQKVLVLTLSTILLLSTQSVLAQKKIKSGAIVYEVIDVQTTVPELKLMKGTKTTLYFTPEQQKIDIDLNNETIKIQTFYNSRNDDIIVLYDFMGQHFKVNSNYKNTPIVKPFVKDISYLPLTTKTIAGFKCHKAIITFEDEELTIWVTNRIKVKNPDFESLFPGLEGFPLEYIRRGENTRLSFRAKIVSEIVLDKNFEVSQKYKEISEKEFNERMGGMRFGF